MNENEIWKRKQRSEEYKNVQAVQLAETLIYIVIL